MDSDFQFSQELMQNMKIMGDELSRLREIIADIASCGIDDIKGLRYVNVQMDRSLWTLVQDESKKH